MDAVVDVTVTVLRVLLFVLHVCILRECKGYGNAGVGGGGGVVVVSGMWVVHVVQLLLILYLHLCEVQRQNNRLDTNKSSLS